MHIPVMKISYYNEVYKVVLLNAGKYYIYLNTRNNRYLENMKYTFQGLF
jgi:hypothetical protein